MIIARWVTAVTGLHDMDEFVQSQLILAVSFYFLFICLSASNLGEHVHIIRGIMFNLEFVCSS